MMTWFPGYDDEEADTHYRLTTRFLGMCSCHNFDGQDRSSGNIADKEITAHPRRSLRRDLAFADKPVGRYIVPTELCQHIL